MRYNKSSVRIVASGQPKGEGREGQKHSRIIPLVTGSPTETGIIHIT